MMNKCATVAAGISNISEDKIGNSISQYMTTHLINGYYIYL